MQLEKLQQEKTNLELQIRNTPKINQQLDDLRLELNRSHELRKSLESCIVEMSKELDDLKLQLSHSQGKQKELESRLEKMPFLRDYAYQQDLQIDLLKVRIESLENRQI